MKFASEIAAKQDLVCDLRTKLFEASSSQEETKEQISELTADLAMERSADAELLAKIDAAEGAREKAVTEGDKVTHALVVEREDSSRLRNDLRQRTNAVAQVKRLNEKVSDCSRDNKMLVEKNNNLNRELKATELDLTLLRGELDSSNKQKATLETRITTLTEEISQCRASGNSLVNEVSETRRLLQAQKKNNQALHGENTRLNDKLNDLEEVHKEKVAAWMECLERKEVDIQQLQFKNAEHHKTLEGVRGLLLHSKPLTAAKTEDVGETVGKESTQTEVLVKSQPSSTAQNDRKNPAPSDSAQTHNTEDLSPAAKNAEPLITSDDMLTSTVQTGSGDELDNADNKTQIESTASTDDDTIVFNPTSGTQGSKPRLFLPFTKPKASKTATAGPSTLPKKLPSFQKKVGTTSHEDDESIIKRTNSASGRKHGLRDSDTVQRPAAKRQATEKTNISRPQPNDRRVSYYHTGIWR